MKNEHRSCFWNPINRTDAYKSRKENRDRRLANRRKMK